MEKTNRKEDRRRVLKTGKIEIGNKTIVECTIRNLNSTGAKLQVADTYWVPENFILHIVNEDIRRACIVRWRSEVDLGIKFVDRAEPS